MTIYVDLVCIKPPENRDESDDDSRDTSGALIDNLSVYSNLAKSIGRQSPYSPSSRVSPDIRYDHMDHIIENIPTNKQRRYTTHTIYSNLLFQELSPTELDFFVTCLKGNIFFSSIVLFLTHYCTRVPYTAQQYVVTILRHPKT